MVFIGHKYVHMPYIQSRNGFYNQLLDEKIKLANEAIDNNEFEITGGEYNPAKFKAVDEIKHLRKPFLPIPPQADMEIPDAPKNLNLFDLTFRGSPGGPAAASSGSSSGY